MGGGGEDKGEKGGPEGGGLTGGRADVAQGMKSRDEKRREEPRVGSEGRLGGVVKKRGVDAMTGTRTLGGGKRTVRTARGLPLEKRNPRRDSATCRAPACTAARPKPAFEGVSP